MGPIGSYITGALPTWLRGPAALGVITTITDAADALRSDLLAGAAEASIDEASPTSYPQHLRQSALPVVVGEAAAVTLAELRARWLRARGVGTGPTMAAHLARLGWAATITSQADLLEAGEVNPFGGNVGFFFVTLTPLRTGLISRAGLWRDSAWLWRQARRVWGAGTVTRAEIEDIVAIVRRYKPANTSCRYLRLPNGRGGYRSFPVGEAWERDPLTGGARPYYSLSWAKEIGQ